MARPEGTLTAFRRGGHATVFNVWAVSSVRKEEVNYVVPVAHAVRGQDMFGRTGGGGYDAYGIDKERGAIVVVHPDGYVGIVAPFEGLRDVDGCFASFMAKA